MMAAAKKMAFPADTCGGCKYCRTSKADKGVYLCWVSPPTVVDTGGEEYGAIRGIEVGLDDPACHLFHQRANG